MGPTNQLSRTEVNFGRNIFEPGYSRLNQAALVLNYSSQNKQIIGFAMEQICQMQKEVLERITYDHSINEEEKREKLKTMVFAVQTVVEACNQQLDLVHYNYNREQDAINNALHVFSTKCFGLSNLVRRVIRVVCDVGWGNNLYIRGHGISILSWDRGLEMLCKGNYWEWEVPAQQTKTFSFQVLINDRTWKNGENHICADRSGTYYYSVD